MAYLIPIHDTQKGSVKPLVGSGAALQSAILHLLPLSSQVNPVYAWQFARLQIVVGGAAQSTSEPTVDPEDTKVIKAK